MRRYRAWRAAYGHARKQVYIAPLLRQGATSLARVVEWLTKRQGPYYLEALPVLYALIETLQMHKIINRHYFT